MSEVNGHKISVNQLNYSGIQKQNLEISPEGVETTEATPQLTDFSDNKAEALGRSMLFKGADNINNDLKALVDNPQIAENSDKMFDLSYNLAIETGMENPYEEAASASTMSV